MDYHGPSAKDIKTRIVISIIILLAGTTVGIPAIVGIMLGSWDHFWSALFSLALFFLVMAIFALCVWGLVTWILKGRSPNE